MNTLANVIKLLILLISLAGLEGCATFNETSLDIRSLVGAESGCVTEEVYDDPVTNLGFLVDRCIEQGLIQGVLVEMPEPFWKSMFRYTTAGHHGALWSSKGKPHRVQWMWAGVTGNGNDVPFKIRLWAIIEGMETFDPDAHAVIMDARGKNAYDLHGNPVPEFSGKDYREGKWAKLATLGESTRLGGAVAMFEGEHLVQLKQQIRQYATMGRFDIKDPHTGKKFAIGTPFNTTDPEMQRRIKVLAGENVQYSHADIINAAIEGFAISPSPYSMALSTAFVAWDLVTLKEVEPDSDDAVGVVKRMNNELERFTAKFSLRDNR